MPNGNDKPFIDWDNTPQIEPEHPLSKPLNKNTDIKSQVIDLLNEIQSNPSDFVPNQPGMRQPTDEEVRQFLLAKVGCSSEEELSKKIIEQDHAWADSLNNFYREAMKPIQKTKDSEDWGRKPIDQEEYTEEMARISAIPVNGGDTDE